MNVATTFCKIFLSKCRFFKEQVGPWKSAYFSIMKYFGFIILTRSVSSNLIRSIFQIPWQYPTSGYNQATPLRIRLNRGTPVAFLLLKQTCPGNVLNRSFSIWREVIKWSLEDARTIWYETDANYRVVKESEEFFSEKFLWYNHSW